MWGLLCSCCGMMKKFEHGSPRTGVYTGHCHHETCEILKLHNSLARGVVALGATPLPCALDDHDHLIIMMRSQLPQSSQAPSAAFFLPQSYRNPMPDWRFIIFLRNWGASSSRVPPPRAAGAASNRALAAAGSRLVICLACADARWRRTVALAYVCSHLRCPVPSLLLILLCGSFFGALLRVGDQVMTCHRVAHQSVVCGGSLHFCELVANVRTDADTNSQL